MIMSKRNLVLVYFLFLCTGGTALIYQVTWTRDLTLIFGASYQAISIVLAAFMAGLALGGITFGLLCDRFSRPLKIYSLLECSVAVFALALPFALDGIDSIYIDLARRIDGVTPTLTFFRIFLSFGVILLPTVFMGGTLPILTRYMVRRNEDFSNRVSLLYGINTFGAVLGTFLSGFILLPAFGVRNTQLIAVVINLIIAGIAWYIDLKWKASLVPEKPVPSNISRLEISSEDPSPPDRSYNLIFWGTAVCGMCALAFEVLWTRSLSISLGTTTYCFSIMLITFLTGIALGGFLRAIIPLKKYSLSIQFSFVLILLCISSMVVTQLIPSIPQISLEINQLIYGHLEGVRPLTLLSIGFLIMLVPTILFGMAFPMAAQARMELKNRWGQSVGDCVGLNTAGAIIGSLLAGFVLIPTLGLHRSMLWISILLGGYGILIVCDFLSHKIQHVWLAWAACFIGWIGLATIPQNLAAWDYHLLGTFRNNAGDAFVNSNDVANVKNKLSYSSLIFYREGQGSTVSVTQSKKQRSLLINGKSVATDGFRDIGLEKLMGHIPCLLHPNPKSALVIGLGAGVTLGAVNIYPTMEKVQLVEIEPVVLDAAELFNHVNNQALETPKLEIQIQDGRNYLKTTTQKFDVITADPIHPWAAGSTYLYTTEYYQIAKSRLNSGGIMCQWLPLYELSLDNVKSIMRTFTEVFKTCQLWQTNLDTIMVGSDSPLPLDIELLMNRLNSTNLSEDLLQIDITDVFSLLALFVTESDGMKTFSAGGVVNTDDNLYLEFSSPYNLGGKSTLTNLYTLSQFRVSPLHTVENIPQTYDNESFKQRWNAYQQVEYKLLIHELMSITAAPSPIPKCQPEIIGELETLLGRLPDYRKTKHLLSNYSLNCALSYMHSNDVDKAKEYFTKALDMYPSNARAHSELAMLLADQGNIENAVIHVERALAINAMNADPWIHRGTLHEMSAEFQKAEACYKQALKIRPSYSIAHYKLGVLFSKMKKTNHAFYQFMQSLRENPRFTEAFTGMATILFQQQKFSQAKQLFEDAIEIDPDNFKAHCGLGMFWQIQHDYSKAIYHYQKALEEQPEFALAHFNLAVVYHAANQLPKAKHHLEQAEQYGYVIPEEFRTKLDNAIPSNNIE